MKSSKHLAYLKERGVDPARLGERYFNDRHLSGAQTTESAIFKVECISFKNVENYDEEHIEELIRRAGQ